MKGENLYRYAPLAFSPGGNNQTEGTITVDVYKRQTGFSGNTFADDTIHTLKFFYLERGHAQANLRLRYNLIPKTETSLIKTDENGKALENATFSLYQADASYQDVYKRHEGKTELAKEISEKSQTFAKTYANVEIRLSRVFRWISGWVDKLLFNQKHGKIVALMVAVLFYFGMSSDNSGLFENMKSAETLGAVSYTHLDVYKRQIYILGLVLEWIEEMGGLAVMAKRNEEKAKLLYTYLDTSDFYQTQVNPSDRSLMNVTFRSPNAELDALFAKESAAAGMSNLKGHRAVGGMRASIYNAMPMEGVETLIAFMKKFEEENK